MAKPWNEAMISLENGQYMYFETDAPKAEDAFNIFLERCDDIRLNIDNLDIVDVRLRNKDGEDIDILTLKPDSKYVNRKM